MKSIRFRFLVAALAVVLGAAISKAQTSDAAPPPPPDHGPGFGLGHFGYLAKELNVTDAQKAQMKEVFQKEHATMKPLMMQLHQMDQQLKQYEEGAYDQAKVQAIVSQQAQALVQMKVEETRIHNELYQLLTPDQQAQLKQIESRHEARMQQHMQEQSNDSQQ